MKVKAAVTVLLTVLLGFFPGCRAASDGSSSPTVSSGQGILLGVSIIDSSNLYYFNLANGIKKEASRSGVQAIVKDAQSDSGRQQNDIEEFIQKKADAVIVAAIDQQSLDPVLEKARKSGIKVIAQSTKVENCDLFISADEWDMGHMLGEYVGKWIRDNLNGKTEYALINYPEIRELANREKGIRDGIREFAPDAKLVTTAVGASNPTQAYEAGLNILENYPNIKIIVGTNDNGALGAYNAFRDKRMLSSKMLFGGIDASSDALNLIQKNTSYRCTVDTMPEYNGILDVDFALKLMRGQTVPEQFKIQTRLVTA